MSRIGRSAIALARAEKLAWTKTARSRARSLPGSPLHENKGVAQPPVCLDLPQVAQALASRCLPVMVFSLAFRGFRDIVSLETSKRLQGEFDCTSNSTKLPQKPFSACICEAGTEKRGAPQLTPSLSGVLRSSCPGRTHRRGAVGRHGPVPGRLEELCQLPSVRGRRFSAATAM